MKHKISDVWDVPLPTNENIMKDKNFNYNLLAKLMLESNMNEGLGELSSGDYNRYIYKSTFKELVEPYFLEGENKISKKTFDKHWRYVRRSNFNLINSQNSENGIIYMVNYKNSNGNGFVTIRSDILKKLIDYNNINVLKTYLVLKYTCNNHEYTQVSQEWLCEKIGFSKGSRSRMSLILNVLKNDLKLIKTKIISNETMIVGDREIPVKKQYIRLIKFGGSKMNKDIKKRIPTTKDFNKSNVNDWLYGYLQSKSYVDGEGRTFVYKEDVNISRIARNFPSKNNKVHSRRKLSRDFNKLIELGLVSTTTVFDVDNREVKAYELPYTYEENYKLIPIKTLNVIIEQGFSKLLNVYVYLLSKFEWKKQTGRYYKFTKKELISECLGLKSTTNGRDYEKINKCLDILVELKLIKIEDYYCNVNALTTKIKLVNVVKYYQNEIMSKGEEFTKSILDEYGCKYETQKKFDDLTGLGSGQLSYDFFVDDRLLIEIQGEQHFKPVAIFGGEEQYKKQLEHDRRKRDYAKEHGYELLEIPYFGSNKSEILERMLRDRLESIIRLKAS